MKISKLVLRVDASWDPKLVLGKRSATSSPRLQGAKRNRTAGEPEGRDGLVLGTALRRGRDLSKRIEAQESSGKHAIGRVFDMSKVTSPNL